MTRLYTAELLKLRTLRGSWGFLLATVVLAGLVTAGNVGGVAEAARFEPRYQFKLVLDTAFATGILALLLGMLLVTNEFRHGTIARTLLAAPRRDRLVAIKLLAGATTGLLLQVAALLVSLLVAVVWLRALGVAIDAGDLLDGSGRALLGVVLAGVLGAAIGAAVHSQVGALVGTLVWLLVAERIVWVLLSLIHLDGVASYLPAATVLGMLATDGQNLSYAGTAGMFVVWTCVVTVLAVIRTNRKDVT
jgi:ABC-2 type transport system permease protein